MWNSLRLRLVLAFLIVVVVAVATVAIVSSQSTESAFEQYLGERPLLRPAPPATVSSLPAQPPLPRPLQPIAPDLRLGLPEQTFINSANGALWLAALIASIAGVVLGFLFSRQIVRPIEAMTLAARRLEQGDLSQRVDVKNRDELGVLAKAFNSMAAELSQTEQLRRNMISDVAHELRTPLTNIRAYLEALQDGYVSPEPAMINSLLEETMLLNRLVDDLQELTLAESGKLKFCLQPLELSQLIEKAIGSFQARAQGKNILVKSEFLSRLPPVLADQERTGQVLRNLLDNALAYTPNGGQVMVTAVLEGSLVWVSIIDDGEGIGEEHLPYIFERFYRVDRSRARATGGSGLGLAIVKQLVQSQGGQLMVESKLGAGSKFPFSLPSV